MIWVVPPTWRNMGYKSVLLKAGPRKLIESSVTQPRITYQVYFTIELVDSIALNRTIKPKYKTDRVTDNE